MCCGIGPIGPSFSSRAVYYVTVRPFEGVCVCVCGRVLLCHASKGYVCLCRSVDWSVWETLPHLPIEPTNKLPSNLSMPCHDIHHPLILFNTCIAIMGATTSCVDTGSRIAILQILDLSQLFHRPSTKIRIKINRTNNKLLVDSFSTYCWAVFAFPSTEAPKSEFHYRFLIINFKVEICKWYEKLGKENLGWLLSLFFVQQHGSDDVTQSTRSWKSKFYNFEQIIPARVGIMPTLYMYYISEMIKGVNITGNVTRHCGKIWWQNPLIVYVIP